MCSRLKGSEAVGNACNRHELILQNLVDAGCDDELVKQCITLIDEENYTFLKCKLSSHRSKILKGIRLYQGQLDSLDYLLYQFKDK